MDIRVVVEHLVLEGFDLPRHHHPLLQATVEAELARLLAADGLAGDLAAPLVVPRLAGGSLARTGSDPIVLGKEIAAAVYAGIGPSSGPAAGAR